MGSWTHPRARTAPPSLFAPLHRPQALEQVLVVILIEMQFPFSFAYLETYHTNYPDLKIWIQINI